MQVGLQPNTSSRSREMNKLKREDLMSLEEYDQARPEFRQKVMAHKKNRLVRLNENA
ncbi:DUF3501 family protein, partial [Thiolapillus sp.]|uniref:DUF3501 family protein n=1 Tax=Thiolapillus sp. TaxID=2017437 RepID=UPI003AF858EA